MGRGHAPFLPGRWRQRACIPLARGPAWRVIAGGHSPGHLECVVLPRNCRAPSPCCLGAPHGARTPRPSSAHSLLGAPGAVLAPRQLCRWRSICVHPSGWLLVCARGVHVWEGLRGGRSNRSTPISLTPRPTDLCLLRGRPVLASPGHTRRGTLAHSESTGCSACAVEHLPPQEGGTRILIKNLILWHTVLDFLSMELTNNGALEQKNIIDREKFSDYRGLR